MIYTKHEHAWLVVWLQCLSEIDLDVEKVVPVILSRMVVRYGSPIFAEGTHTIVMLLLSKV